jgi:O-antigen/teichoic acid export membrane protein
VKKSLSFYAAFYVLSLALMRGSGIAAKILLARSITPFEYGLITLFVIAIPGLLQNITNFCFFDIMGDATEGRKYFGFSLVYGILSTLIVAVVLFFIHIPFFRFLNVPEQFWTILYLALLLSLLSVTLGGNVFGFLRGLRNHAGAAAFSASPSILRVAFIFAAIYVFNLSDFTLILLLFALPPLIPLLPVIIIKFKAIRRALTTITLPSRDIMIFGFAFFILNIWVGISQQINSVVISHDLGVEWQGYFDVSLSLVAVITFFSSAVYLISAPERTAESNPRELLHKKGGLGDVGRLLFCMCLISVLILCFYSHKLVALLFTPGYIVAADYLYILAIGYAILFVQQFVAFLNITKGDGFSRLTIVTLISILLFPLFTHVMIIHYGFQGAYLASSSFIIIYTGITILLARDRSPIKILLKKIDRLALTCIITGLFIWLFPLPLVQGVLSSLALFFALAILSGYLDIALIIEMLHFSKNET